MGRPSLLLVHGAANGAWVWDFWRAALKSLGWEVNVLDLRGHGRSLPIDFSVTTMDDYVGDVESVAGQIAAAQGQHPVIGGWSMGGLVAMIYASRHPETPALLLLAPSPPLEVAGRGTPEEVRRTPAAPFGVELYGLYPEDFERSQRALRGLTEEEARRVLANSAGAQESGLARRQRKRGISVASVGCPTLVVYGDGDRMISPEDSRATAVHLGGESLAVAGATHWGIVFSESVVGEVASAVGEWLTGVTGSPANG